jgi:Domain of unknown function (DUF222)
MENLGLALVESASAVAALGCSRTAIESLDDASVLAGMTLVREHQQHLQTYQLWLAAAISRRSDHEFGDGGLARRNGSATPRDLIQQLTGASLIDAAKLASLGAMAVAAEDAAKISAESAGGNAGAVDGGFETGIAPVVSALTAGELSLDAADAIRRGLGRADAAVTDEQLREAAIELVARAGLVPPEALLRLARQARNDLDLAAVERGQKQRADLRYVRRFRRDGMCGGSWLLPEEDGGLEIDTALQLLLASRTGGPRFPATDRDGNPIDRSRADATADEVSPESARTNEQVLADGFAQVFHNGITADPSVIPGAQRAAVRVIVTEEVLAAGLDTGAGTGGDGDIGTSGGGGSALLEETLTAITFGKLAEYLCEGGTVDVMFDGTDSTDSTDDTNDTDGTDDSGNRGILNVGREHRLFTARQRTALAVRDGGCRFPGCQKPPSWTEAHHVEHWVRDRGKTDIANGLLLCRYHHMLIHNNGWEVRRGDDRSRSSYWLKPPPSIDPRQELIEMRSRNPLLTVARQIQDAG